MLGRIMAIAKNVFWEVMRARVLYILGIFALLMVAAVELMPQVAASLEDKIVLDLGLAAISILSLIVAVFVSTNLINQEIEKRTVYLLISKPVSRPELIIGKHLGLWAVLAVLLVVMTVIYMGVLSLNQIPYPGKSIAISNLFIWIKFGLIGAAGILLGVLTSSLLATLLTFAVYVMGSLSRDLLELGQISDSNTIENVTTAMYVILPDLARLNLKNDAVYADIPDVPILVANAGYGIIYTVLLLALAIAIFSRREL
ncbi:MAG: ABC transporter permease [Limnospira sp. PMC 1291.21]|uniref:ABC transporter permease n=1 Tax=unclassified Limnospira TaxID=2642885 RepID=UPI0028E169FA|nr:MULTISPECIES: ABC transporter permease [unclassified Limnospira]MDT9178537.1 ABC transporter permease [Limnospira sp. PMC 1238.20]MDT9203893.1 ABC transporter permease [Limnospira sp. PMC 1243.20]MDT9209114.1 ABC transporter permease [Limnospira sp. PMC 1252.20]MDT9224576.1 ABC transporter permease [Limnospira sp. PMC 1279.21]MDT9229635.1 ABC transporter permease [Limnospira sp. PMC 1242.20]